MSLITLNTFALSDVMLSVIFHIFIVLLDVIMLILTDCRNAEYDLYYVACCRADCRNAQFRYAKCRYTECRYAECCYAECRCAEFC
jgi:hypothetical protein